MRTIQQVKRYNTLQTVLIWACLMIPASALLYGTSTRVREIEKEIASANASLQQEKDRARVLRAEWAYLNSPKQLATRANKYLAMNKAASPLQIATLDRFEGKVAYRNAVPVTDVTASASVSIAPAAEPLSTKVLAKPIVYNENSLATLHEGKAAHLPSAVTWSQKIVSAFGGAELFATKGSNAR